MKLSTYKPAQRSEIPGAQEWIDRFMLPINSFLKDVADLFHGQVGEENLNEEIRDISVQHDQEVELVLSKIRGKPRSVWVTPVGYFNYSTYAWDVIDLKRIKLKVFFFNAPTEQITVRVKIEGM